MGEQPEGIGIAFKVGDVRPELRRHQWLQLSSGAFREVGLNGFLTTTQTCFLTFLNKFFDFL